ncbi:hypothetical protein [Emticicia agri]|uniref:DUF4848 domain-containing protein n=1 Tax=Emticicia agri TaxID=2492393 RepID=A0A4V1ZCT4_9BACT|nr:hypothetical protein [Emticicia agri]RYU93770.1 hypothetical protein EWM59_20400 [Emticicia agri]
MKKHSFSKLLIALFAVSCSFYFLVSCKDQSSQTEPQPSKQAKKITVVNGKLKFVDEAHFMDTWALLRKMRTEEELDNWENQLPGFVSQRTAFNNLTEADIEKISKTSSVKGYEDFATLIPDFDGVNKRLVKQVDGNAYGSLYNKEGFVIVGKDAIKYTRDKITKFENYKETDFLRYKNGESLSNVRSSKIVVEHIKSNAKTKEISQREHCTTYYDGDKRFSADYNLYKCRGTTCALNEHIFMRMNATAMHEKKSFFIWFGENATELKREGAINVSFSLDDGPYSNRATIDYETDLDSPGGTGLAVYSVWVRVKGKIGTTPY